MPSVQDLKYYESSQVTPTVFFITLHPEAWSTRLDRAPTDFLCLTDTYLPMVVNVRVWNKPSYITAFPLESDGVYFNPSNNEAMLLTLPQVSSRGAPLGSKEMAG